MKLNNQNNPLDLILLIEEQLRSTLSILKNCSEEIIQSWYSEEVKYLSEALQKTMNRIQAQIRLCSNLYPDILAHQNLLYR